MKPFYIYPTKLQRSWKTLLLLFLNVSFLVFNSFAQVAPGIEWQKSFGGTRMDYAHSIIQTIDNGYAIAGETNSPNTGDVFGLHGGVEYWIVKIDGLSNLEWQKCLGGGNRDVGNAIEQTFDGSYIVTGYSYSFDGNVSGHHGICDYWIAKIDSASNLIWQKSLGGSDNDWAMNMGLTNDSGIVAVGFSESFDGNVNGNHGYEDIWIVKLNSIGQLLWQKCLGGIGAEYGYSIHQTTDNGFAIGGFTFSNDGDVNGNHGSSDYWIIKLDSSGNFLWQKCLGGSHYDIAYSMIVTKDNGYALAGYSTSNDSDVSGNHDTTGNYADFWVVKTNSVGNIEWEKCFGGTNADIAQSLYQCQDGGYIIAGYTNSYDYDVNGNHGYFDYWIIKLDSSGNLKWQKCLGGSNNYVATSVKQTNDGSYIVAGYSSSNNGDVSVNHDTIPPFTTDYWIVKLFPDTITSITQLPNPQLPFSISPNPSSGLFQITLPNFSKVQNFGKVSCEVINTLGQKVFSSDFRLLTSKLK